MKIAVFEAEDWEAAACAGLRPAHEVRCTRYALARSTAGDYADAEVVSPFIASRIYADVLEKLPALRFVATRSTGYDHIDLEACNRRGIVVANRECAKHEYGEPGYDARHAERLVTEGLARLVPGKDGSEGEKTRDKDCRRIQADRERGDDATEKSGNPVGPDACGASSLVGFAVAPAAFEADEQADRERKSETEDQIVHQSRRPSLASSVRGRIIAPRRSCAATRHPCGRSDARERPRHESGR
jgi:hypothetical protein